MQTKTEIKHAVREQYAAAARTYCRGTAGNRQPQALGLDMIGIPLDADYA